MKRKKTIILIIMIILSITLIISIINIFIWKLDSNNTEKQIDKIKKNITIEEIKDNKETTIVEQIEEIPDTDPYWDYIKMDLINVDFNNLKNINPETKGWIQVKGTNINYPFVQSSNNDYYLNHSFDKTYNQAGWVFLDYRNNLGNSDKNTIIYAHGRLDNTMFGTLKNILQSNWIENSDNYIVKLSTEYENTLWQIFSVYKIPNTNDYIKTTFSSDSDYLKFLNTLLNRSSYDFNTSISKNDRILTLSTCYDRNNKVVLHAKLIKRESK